MTTSTTTGKMAHTSTQPANPNATPPHSSRCRLLVRRSPSNRARAPSRQNSTSHGSTRMVRAVDTLSG